MSEPTRRDETESTAEREGIVDQQDAALEAMHSSEGAEGAEGAAGQEPGGEVDPMEGEAPTG